VASGLVRLARAVVPAVGTTITGVADYLVLLAPSANRVYTAGVRDIAAAELALVSPDVTAIEPVTIAGVNYLRFTADDPDVDALSRLSTAFAVFAAEGDLLRPIELPHTDVFDDDLVSIPKYQGKTNEQFTRLMVNATLSAVRREPPPFSVLDPLCGRGTTLSTVWTLGHDAAGVDIDLKAVEAYATFLTTYLKRKRISHTAELSPVRREGRPLGKRLRVTVRPDDARPQDLTVFTGDARDSGALFGKRTFDAIVTDAPYGVVHGSRTGTAGTAAGRDRSPAGLLQAAVPVWASQLRTGGALGIAWNTYGMDRAELSMIASAAGLQPCPEPGFLGFAHRVDSSIRRDLFVARKP
jgi:hypothetical protein